MMRLLKAAAIAAVGAREFYFGKPQEGIDECFDTNDACQQAFLTQDDQPFQNLSDPQFSITYPLDIFDRYRTTEPFLTCLSLAELAFISDRFNIQTTNNNTRDPVNLIVKYPLYDSPAYVMTVKVRFFGNGSLAENAIKENLAGKSCSKKLPEPTVLGVSVNDILFYFFTVGSAVVLSGTSLVLLCCFMMDKCSKKTNSEQEIPELTPLIQSNPM